MAISRRYACGDAEVAVWAIEESARQLGEMLGDEAAVCKAFSFGCEARRAEWLAVRLLLRELCGSAVVVEYDAAGRPFLAGAPGYISISHTKGYAVVARSLERPVGLDVELVTRKVGVARSFIIDEKELSLVPAEGVDKYLLLRWTACEAMYKLVGGTNYKENFRMPVFTPAQSGVCSVSLQGCEAGECALSYVFDAGLLLSLVFAGHASAVVRC